MISQEPDDIERLSKFTGSAYTGTVNEPLKASQDSILSFNLQDEEMNDNEFEFQKREHQSVKVMEMDDDDFDARIWAQFVRRGNSEARPTLFGKKRDMTTLSSNMRVVENESTKYASSNAKSPKSQLSMSFDEEGIRN